MSNAYQAFKEAQAVLEEIVERTGKVLREIPGAGSSPMGLTPDAVKFSPEYHIAKNAYRAAFAALRSFNGKYVKIFKAEIAAERAERYARKTSKMPKFILDHGSPEAARNFNALDAFTQGYIEAMFFTDTGYPENEDLEHASFAELAPKTLARIVADCAKFRDDAKIVACIGERHAAAGHDFWLTRNGHGAGFWDGDWPEPDASYLDARSDTFGNVDLYRGDGELIYLTLDI